MEGGAVLSLFSFMTLSIIITRPWRRGGGGGGGRRGGGGGKRRGKRASQSRPTAPPLSEKAAICGLGVGTTG